MMLRRRALALLAIPALVATVAFAPAVAAQDGSPAASVAPVMCPLIAAAEVGTAFGATDMVANTGSPFYCSFGNASLSVSLSLQPATPLDTVKADNADGSALTVAGHDAWLGADGLNLWADANGSLLEVSVYGATAGPSVQTALTSIAATAIANAPAGPDPAAVAALSAFIPKTIDDSPVTVNTITGAMLSSFMDATDPEVKALVDALAAQGKTFDDVLMAAASVESDSDLGILVIQVKGADASQLLLPLVTGISGDAITDPVTTKEVGGKTVTVIPIDPGILGYASGDIAFYANGSDTFVADFFGSLP